MSNQLGMDKLRAIRQLHAAGYSKRRIARTLGVSRGAVSRHLDKIGSNSTKAPTGSEAQALTGSKISNSTTAPTGSDGSEGTTPAVAPVKSSSRCEPFREQILRRSSKVYTLENGIAYFLRQNTAYWTFSSPLGRGSCCRAERRGCGNLILTPRIKP